MEPQFDSKAMESFNQMVAKGLIEVYDYQCDDRETFLEKWKQQFNTAYNEEQETLAKNSGCISNHLCFAIFLI